MLCCPVLSCCSHTPTDIQLNPVKALVSNISRVSAGVDFTVWLSKEGEVGGWGKGGWGKVGVGIDGGVWREGVWLSLNP